MGLSAWALSVIIIVFFGIMAGQGLGPRNLGQSLAGPKQISLPKFIKPQLLAEDCGPSSALQCYRLTVPLDHNKPDLKPTLGLRAAVHHAPSNPSKEALLLVFGGPGDSGVQGLEDWLPSIDPRLKDRFDLVSFDLRGSHGSGSLDCPQAFIAWNVTPQFAGNTAEKNELIQAAKTFSAACAQEMGLDADALQHYNSAQAVQDLEILREALGYDRFRVYSLSYGTQLMQAYASLYPSRLEALVMDGAVDLSASLLSYAQDITKDQNRILAATMTACTRDPECWRAFGFKHRVSPRRLLQVYQDLRNKLRRHPQQLPGEEELFFTAYDLEYTAWEQISSPESRRRFLSALAKAVRHKDFRTLYALAYGLDEPSFDVAGRARGAGLSQGIYHSFVCNDYGRPTARIDAAAEAFFKGAEAFESRNARIRLSLYRELPCAFWPSAKANISRPRPFKARGFPLLLVTAEGDAAVPSSYGRQIARANQETAVLINVKGGKHVSYGYGNLCIDQPVTAFLLDAKASRDGTITCREPFVAREKKTSTEQKQSNAKALPKL